jgi:hypothetical protein
MADRTRKGVIYKAVRTLSPVEAAYLGGLIDGEGTITLSRRHRDDERQLLVTIANNERAILEYVLHAVGAGRITSKRHYKEAHTPSFTYAIGNRQALDLLKQITIYLRSYKSERAALALTHYIALTPRNGKYTRSLQADREKFIEEFLALSPKSSKAPPGVKA